jgi:predicted PurR-regulated permease PerM
MSSTTSPSLSDVLNSIMNTIVTVLQNVVNVISQNASTIATLLVTGGLVFLVVRYGRRIFSGISDLLRGLF